MSVPAKLLQTCYRSPRQGRAGWRSVRAQCRLPWRERPAEVRDLGWLQRWRRWQRARCAAKGAPAGGLCPRVPWCCGERVPAPGHQGCCGPTFPRLRSSPQREIRRSTNDGACCEAARPCSPFAPHLRSGRAGGNPACCVANAAVGGRRMCGHGHHCRPSAATCDGCGNASAGGQRGRTRVHIEPPIGHRLPGQVQRHFCRRYEGRPLAGPESGFQLLALGRCLHRLRPVHGDHRLSRCRSGTVPSRAGTAARREDRRRAR